MRDDRDLHLALLGATGFTGGLVAEDLATTLPPDRRWAVAGRDPARLRSLVDRLGRRAPDGPTPEMIVADTGDPASLADLAARTGVLATTVGPFVRHGEPVVRACVRAGTEYADITGEPAFVTAMIDRHHDDALRSGVRIVHCCGFDSVPHDLGASLAVRNLPEGVPVRLRGYVSVRGQMSGGTLDTAVEILGRNRGLAGARPDPGPGRRVGSLPRRIARVDAIDGWAVPLPTVDPLIVQRSAALDPRYGPDFRYGHFLRVRNLPRVAVIVAGAATVAGLARVGPGRTLLRSVLRDPGQGPDATTRARSSFCVTFLGDGGGHRVRATVRGGDPGYTETSRMLAEAARSLAEDRDVLPHRAGVLTPATAFGAVLQRRLEARGMTFEVRDEA